jgi:hypothetical protein
MALTEGRSTIPAEEAHNSTMKPDGGFALLGLLAIVGVMRTAGQQRAGDRQGIRLTPTSSGDEVSSR